MVDRVRAPTIVTKIKQPWWDEVHALLAKPTARNFPRLSMNEVKYVGVDKKYFGLNEPFVTILNDL